MLEWSSCMHSLWLVPRWLRNLRINAAFDSGNIEFVRPPKGTYLESTMISDADTESRIAQCEGALAEVVKIQGPRWRLFATRSNC
jgi:hypothetical protein